MAFRQVFSGIMLHSQPNSHIWKHWKATCTLQWSSHSYFCPKHPSPSWYSPFPLFVSSRALWDFCTEAVSPRCPRLAASVPKLRCNPGKRCVPVLWFWDQPPHRQVRLSGDVAESNKISLEALAHDSYWPQLLKHSLLWPWQTSAYCYVFKMLLWICQFEQLVTLFISACWLPPSAMVLPFLRLIWFHFIFRSIPF